LTDAEGLLWWKLREQNSRGFHFRRQAPFRGYVLDFAEHGAKLAVEVDGSQHGEPAQAGHDAVRDRVLANEGYLVLRFATVEVFNELERVMETILRAADARRAPTRRAARVDLPTRGR
jgi:very-short-patch-repair endonuclease